MSRHAEYKQTICNTFRLHQCKVNMLSYSESVVDILVLDYFPFRLNAISVSIDVMMTNPYRMELRIKMENVAIDAAKCLRDTVEFYVKIATDNHLENLKLLDLKTKSP